MASTMDKYVYGGHGVAESTLMLATMAGGHFYNLVHTADLDNGCVSVIKPENYEEEDYFNAEAPAITDKVVLILTAPKIYEEFTSKMQEESNFYNGAGELMRAYELYEGDRFSLSTEAFAQTATPAAGQYVVVDPGQFKLTTSTADPNATVATNAFVGYILKVNNNGTYDVMVKRNHELA